MILFGYVLIIDYKLYNVFKIVIDLEKIML